MSSKLEVAHESFIVKAANLKDLLLGQFMLGVCFASKFLASFSPKPTECFGLGGHSAFLHRILGIGFWSAKPKVIGIDAGGVISTGTIVTNLDSVRNWSMRDLPNKAMGVDQFPINPSEAVTGAGFPSFPQPASVFGFLHFAPKFTEWVSHIPHSITTQAA